MKELNAEQTIFAEWLASPLPERSPGTRKELARQLGLTDRTLQNWKNLPEIIQIVNQLYTASLVDLVGPATTLLKDAIKKPGSISRVSFDCAKYIVQDWSKKYQGDMGVVKSISDLYKKYHQEKRDSH